MARRLGSSGLRSKSSTSTSSTSSLFSTSSAVPRASISKERVPKSNTGTEYKEKSNSDPKNRRHRDRIEEFPGKNLCLRGGKLFYRGAHMRICDAKDYDWKVDIKVKIDRIKLQVIFNFLKI